ncbi:MAG: hypothetical protein ACI4QT_07725 [Kiritimatiellia bacterium]
MRALMLCAVHFATFWMVLGTKCKIVVSYAVNLSKWIRKATEFFFSAVADGIQRLFTRFGKGWKRVREKPTDPTKPRQTLLPLSFKPG